MSSLLRPSKISEEPPDESKKSTRDETKKRQGKKIHFAITNSFLVVVLAACFFCYAFIVRPQQQLSSYLQQNHDNSLILSPQHTIIYPQKFLYFQHMASGQGAGNILSGLLAAHLLAEEFGRILCVSTKYHDFWMAFSTVHAQAAVACRNLPTFGNRHISLSLLNFAPSPPNECALAHILNSSIPVLYITGNTYPRWPAVPDNYFLKYYRPTPQLLQRLPWQSPPHTVVHLRKGDNFMDKRKGLNDETLDALGAMLPPNTFLVTNEVEWYTRFQSKYSWQNAGWPAIKHSAQEVVAWSRTDIDTATNTMQLWADWYTILLAKQVIHTHSDFSISAIHWMNIRNTKTVRGMKTVDGNRVLDLVDESWRRDGETIPLRDRNQVNVSQTDNDMRLCTQPLGFMSNQ